MEGGMASDRTFAASRLFVKPLYLQVRDALVERIGKGEWKPGMAIPNEVDLAREFGISSGTMRKALDQLEGERVLTRTQGRGTFVNDQASAALSSRFWRISAADGKPMTRDSKTIEIAETPANEEERPRLGKHDRVYRIRRVRWHGDRPFMVEDASLPASLFPGLLEKQVVEHRTVALAQEYGVLLGKAEERIAVSSAPAAIANTLGVAPNTPMLLLDRLLLTLDGQPVEWRVAHCHLAGGFYLAEMS
jgi:GntR family transcriptional regulator